MTSASRGRNRVAHHCKVDWCHLVKTLEYQQTDLVLQTLLNGQPVQSISDVAGDAVVLPFVQYQSSHCIIAPGYLLSVLMPVPLCTKYTVMLKMEISSAGVSMVVYGNS